MFELATVMGTSARMIERHYGTLLEGASAGIASRLAAFAPYGLSVPTPAKAVQAKPADDVVHVVQMNPADDADLPTAFMSIADADTAFITAADVRTADHAKFADQDAGGYMPSLHMGGTIILSQPVTYVDPSRTIR